MVLVHMNLIVLAPEAGQARRDLMASAKLGIARPAVEVILCVVLVVLTRSAVDRGQAHICLKVGHPMEARCMATDLVLSAAASALVTCCSVTAEAAHRHFAL